jgi:DNA-binding Lrp family transcriptional regulator
MQSRAARLVRPGFAGPARRPRALTLASGWGSSPHVLPAHRTGLAAIPEIMQAHIVAGSAGVLVKARTASTKSLREVLHRIGEITGVAGIQAIVMFTIVFERPVSRGTDGSG